MLSSSGQLWFPALAGRCWRRTPPEASRFDATREGVGPAALVFLPDFWLVFVALMLSLGSGLTVINNLSQMTAAFPSLREHSAATSTPSPSSPRAPTLSVDSASGVVSDRLAPRVDRVTFAVHLVAAMAAGQAILFVVPEMFPLAGLVFGVAIAGAAFGALFWAMPTLTVELFGARHFGAIRGIAGLSPAAGGYLLSTVFCADVPRPRPGGTISTLGARVAGQRGGPTWRSAAWRRVDVDAGEAQEEETGEGRRTNIAWREKNA